MDVSQSDRRSLAAGLRAPRPGCAVCRPPTCRVAAWWLCWLGWLVGPTPAAEPTNASWLPSDRPIGQVSIDIRPKSKAGSDQLPAGATPQALSQLPYVPGSTAASMSLRASHLVTSPSAAVPYQPLYFEQVNVERYGRYYGPCHPAASAVRFFATIPALPYAMTVHRPHRTYLWDWPYEAGWAAPAVRERPPFQPTAAAVQSATITGLVFLLP